MDIFLVNMAISYIPKSLDDLAFIYNEMNDCFPSPFESITQFTYASKRFIDRTALIALLKGNRIIVLWDIIKETSEHEDTLQSFHEKLIELKLISIL